MIIAIQVLLIILLLFFTFLTLWGIREEACKKKLLKEYLKHSSLEEKYYKKYYKDGE